MAAPTKKAFPLRLDPALYAAIERAAAGDLRSVNAEVECLLREALAKRGVKVAISERPKRGRPPKDEAAWFASKRYGWGAGLPIRWPGWVMVAVVIGLMAAIQTWVPTDRIGTKGWLLLMVVAAAVVMAARHTRGGWRGRWGSKD